MENIRRNQQQQRQQQQLDETADLSSPSRPSSQMIAERPDSRPKSLAVRNQNNSNIALIFLMMLYSIKLFESPF